MLRVALAGIRGHLLRFALTALSVLLGVAFVAGTLVLTDSLDRTFTGIFAQAATGTDVVVRGTEGAASDATGALRRQLPLSLADDLERVDGVADADYSLNGSAVLVGADGTAVRRGGAPTLGVNWLQDDPAVDLVTGEAPSAPGEVAVESGTLELSGLDVGDTTTMLVAGRLAEVTVTGEVDFGALAGATLVFLDDESARAAYAPDGTASTFAVRGEDGVSQGDLRDRVAAVLPAGAEAITGEQQTDEDTAAIREALGFISTFLLVFAGISLVVGSFIIVNTFSMLVAQRTRELALLRAVGATGAQVVRSVLVEALVIGLAGGVLGLGAGIGLAAVLRVVVGSFGLELSGGLPVEPRTVVLSIAVGVVVTLLAAVVPALRAARIAPVAAMRDDIAMPERSLHVRALVGLLLLGAGGAGLWLSLAASGTASAVGVGVSALALFLGTAVAAPVVARPVVGVLAAPFAWTSRVTGRLAGSNALRNPRRTATTASALMVGLTLVVGIGVLSASTTASTRDIVESQVRADLVLNGGFQGIPTGVVDDVRAVPGVASLAALTFVPAVVDGEQLAAVGADPAALDATVEVSMVSGALADLGGDTVLVSQSWAEDHGVAAGDAVTATLGSGAPGELTVGGVYEDNQVIGTPVLVGADVADDVVPVAQRFELIGLLTVAGDADAGAVRAAVTDVVAPYVVVSVQDADEYVSAQADQTQQLLTIIYVLLALSVVIAVLGIVNTLALSVFERTREIGLLRAVGLGRRGLAGTITVESVLTALFGAVLGTALGLVLGVSLQRSLVDEGLTELVVPVGQVAAVFALAAVIGVVAAVLPAVRATRLDVLRAITTE
jgi:putative ABC transport system permease protein